MVNELTRRENIKMPYVSSTGAVVVLRRGFLVVAGAGASSSDLTKSETFSAIDFFVGDLELLAKRL